jgi:signal transduction histidine kinase/CheY-like chemotaxis protein/HPt (histidine-containing phosphotransfer) domain-containing protein
MNGGTVSAQASHRPATLQDGTLALRPSEMADVRSNAGAALARQSVPGLFANWVLAAVILGTSTVARAYPAATVVAATWMGLLGAARLVVARSFGRLYPSRPTSWLRLFSAGVLLSSATWGLGGAVLITASGGSRDSWLVLLTVAGICAGGLTSLSPDIGLVRLHIACLTVPTLAAGLLLPGAKADAVGFGIVVVAFAAYLWIQGGHVNASFTRALANTRLLERQAADLDAARVESLEASRVKSEFLANMSHEIRTPMAAVLGYADLLLDPSIRASDRVNHVQTIRRNGAHLMSLIDDILDVSKIEAGKMTTERIATSSHQVITDVASLMRVRAAEKNVSFDVKYVGPIPETIQSDPTRLRQIVLNLVGNAIKFTDKGGITVTVRCEAPASPDPKLVVEVADTGIGMSEEQIRGIFATFAQADASTTRRFGGSGLGLAISKRLAGLLGGDIVAESTPGRGSLFRLTVATGPLAGVPMASGLAEAVIEARVPSELPRPSAKSVASLPPSCRVLLAEDGYDNQVLVSAMLVKAGATVKVVADGQLAVQEATSAEAAGNPYDVVLMDMQMPVLDGYGATSMLRVMGYKGAVVALTAHAMAGDRERCESAGCDDYLSKPVDRAKLVAIVARFATRQESSGGLVSTFANDEEMKDLVQRYTRELPQRSLAMIQAAEASHLDVLKRLAHQLSGSAGGYGFPSITEAARAVEQGVVNGVDELTLRSRVEALAALCRSARAA